MFRFLQPGWFWLLLILPLVLLCRGRVGPVAAVQFSSINLVRRAAQNTRSRTGAWVWLWSLLAAILLVAGLARPQFAHGSTQVEASGIDIMLALDISGSMQALDFELAGERTNRIEVVKSIVGQFIDARPSDRIGIIAFAGAPYLVSPLTLDHDWLQQNLTRVKIGGVDDGTAIGSAIATGVNRLRGTQSKSKIIVLLTDGMNNLGKISPLAAADSAKALGIKVYTIGAGTRGEAPTPVQDQFGQTHIVNVKVDVDEETLEKIADITGGKFYRATNTDSLRNIYAEINRLEKTTYTVNKFEHYQELFAWALLPALALLGLGILLEQTRYRRLP